MRVPLVRHLSVKYDKGILAEFMVRGVFLHSLKKFDSFEVFLGNLGI